MLDRCYLSKVAGNGDGVKSWKGVRCVSNERQVADPHMHNIDAIIVDWRELGNPAGSWVRAATSFPGSGTNKLHRGATLHSD